MFILQKFCEEDVSMNYTFICKNKKHALKCMLRHLKGGLSDYLESGTTSISQRRNVVDFS